MLHRILAALAISVVATGVSHAQSDSRATGSRAATAAVPKAIEDFDIAGVKLGMSPAEVRQALDGKGFTLSAVESRDQSFARLVEWAASQRQQPVPNVPPRDKLFHVSGVDGSQNKLFVEFVDMPQGPEVAKVSLTFNPNFTDLQSLPKDLERKYGKPTQVGSLGLLWCKAEISCYFFDDEKGANFKYDSSFGHQLILSNIAYLWRQREAAVANLFTAKPSADRQRDILGF